MVITSNDITQKNYKKLSIQVSLSGLSFCVIDLVTHKILTFYQTKFIKNQVLESQLWKAFIDNPLLAKPYDEILVIHANSLNTFVPQPFFDKSKIASYLQYNVKVFESDFFAFDTLSNYEMINVFVPYANVTNFLLDQFESFDYKNSNSILVEKLLDYSKNIDEKLVFVHIQEDHFEIIVARNQQLLLFNSFEFQTAEDFIYYVLFTFEQLQLNPELINLLLLGTINKSDELFKIAYKFIRNCSILDIENKANSFDVTEEELLKHYILFNS